MTDMEIPSHREIRTPFMEHPLYAGINSYMRRYNTSPLYLSRDHREGDVKKVAQLRRGPPPKLLIGKTENEESHH